MTATANDTLFEEEQSFRQRWLWGLLIFAVLGLSACFAFVLVLALPNADRLILPGAIALGVEIAVAVFLAMLRLRVRVDAGHLHVRFVPLVRKDIPLDEIATWEVRTYRPILEYGGWGVRYSLRKGTAYNVSGNRGVQLVLTNGKRVLIGSQRPEELAAAIRQAKNQGPATAAV